MTGQRVSISPPGDFVFQGSTCVSNTHPGPYSWHSSCREIERDRDRRWDWRQRERENDRERKRRRRKPKPLAPTAIRAPMPVINSLSIRCILGDLRLWVGDPSSRRVERLFDIFLSCLMISKSVRPTNPESITLHILSSPAAISIPICIEKCEIFTYIAIARHIAKYCEYISVLKELNRNLYMFQEPDRAPGGRADAVGTGSNPKCPTSWL